MNDTIHAQLTGVTRIYPAAAGHPPVHALGPVDLGLRMGEFFSIVGPSGCGKSTLLEIVAGLQQPTAGAVAFEGRSVTGDVPEGIGVVFQEDASFPWLTVWDNVAFGLRRAGASAVEVGRRVDDAVAFLGLRDFARAYPPQLSGGMRQRVCIARTLVLQPRLILLDEPFGALDAQTRLLMGEEVLRLWRRTGATVLLITHALDEAAMLSDRVGAMSARPGRFIEIIETGWKRERDSTIVREAAFAEITGRLWANLRGESMKASQMAVSLASILVSGDINSDIMRTLGMIAAAVILSVIFGFALGLLVHALPRVREVLDPLFATYYAVPIFIFYPVLVAIFGLSLVPILLIGVATAMVAMIIATLNGLDRVPRVLSKVARVHRMGRVATALRLQLPAAAPYLFTGVKLSVSYAFIAVIASEFILAPAGLGRDIADAYADFNNPRMYALMLLILVIATFINMVLHAWDLRWAQRRGRGPS